MDTLPSAGGVCKLNWMRMEKQISPVPILSKLFFKPVVYVDVRGPVQTSQYACRQHKYETHTQTQYTNTRDTKILKDITSVVKNNKLQTQIFETTLPK